MNDTMLTPGTDNHAGAPTVIPCPGCESARTIQSRKPSAVAAARARMCRRCAASAAALQRWTPNGDDIDEVTVDRLVAGQLRNARTASTRAERLAAVDRLTRYGLSAPLIAARMGVTQRTVERLRADIRNPRAAEAATDESEAA
jgi:DNA-binding NarL/FixJ family response regulator